MRLQRGGSFWIVKWGPPREGLITFVFCNYFVKHLIKVKHWETRGWEAQRSLWAAQQSDPFFCINVKDLEGKMDFFPVRLVKT